MAVCALFKEPCWIKKKKNACFANIERVWERIEKHSNRFLQNPQFVGTNPEDDEDFVIEEEEDDGDGIQPLLMGVKRGSRTHAWFLFLTIGGKHR